MTNKRLIWKKPDGSICITIPAPKGRREGESEADWIERVRARAKDADPHLADCVGLSDCMAADLPGSRRFRNCWRDDGTGRLAVDMTRARDQRMSEIRAERDQQFASLDNEWMRATGQGKKAEADAIEAKRQALRDIPQNTDLEAVATPEELEAFQPTWPELK